MAPNARREEGYKILDRIFNPESVAIVGVASEGFGFGRGILLSLQAIGFHGKLFPVNPKGGSTAGLPIFRSVAEIPGPVDFAVIAVPAPGVPRVLEECLDKGVAGVEILSAGFRETGTPEGEALEEEIKKIAAKGIRVIGPNCFGVYSPRSGLTMLPGPDLSREEGPVGFISQSGGHSVDLAQIGRWKGIRFSKVVSIGNGADLRETELLDYMGSDPATGIIGMYIEGVGDGRKFFAALKKVAAGKPVVVYKGGLSEAGGRAVASHTASMGGTGVIWESMLRQCNAVRVTDIGELADACLAFSLLPLRNYRGLSIIGGGGALGVAAADAAESHGMTIPRLRDDLQEKINPLLPRPGSSAANPIDIANPFVSPATLKEVMLLAARDERIDIQIMTQLLYHYKSLKTMTGVSHVRDITPVADLVRAVREAVDATGKPVLLIIPNHKRERESMDIEEVCREARKAFLDQGIPVFDSLTEALRAVAGLSGYCRRRIRQPEKEKNRDAISC